MKLKVTRKGHAVKIDGKLKTLAVGDTFEGSERSLKAFGDRLAVVSGSKSVSVVPDDDVKAVLDANANDAGDLLPNLSLGQLDVLAELETRKGVGEAIKAERITRG